MLAMNTKIQALKDDSNYLSFYTTRMLIVQTLYSIDMLNKKKNVEKIALEYIEYSKKKHFNHLFNKKQYLELLYYTINNIVIIDSIIILHLNKTWKLHRLFKIVLSILRAGIADILKLNHSNIANAINDYLQIANSLNYFRELGFINSVLNKVAKHKIKIYQT